MATTIADLILEQGRIQADQRRRSGERRGELITSLSQLPGQIVADRQAAERLAIEKARAKRQDDLAAQTLEKGKFDLEQARTSSARQSKLADVVANAGAIDPETGEFDLPKAQAYAQTKGYTDLGADLSQFDQEHDAKLWQTAATKTLATQRAEPKLTTLGPGQRLVDASGTEIASVPEKVTFSQPQPMMVGGQRKLVRTGSDNKLYDMAGQVVSADVAPDVAPMNAGEAARLAEEQRHNRVTETTARENADTKNAPIDVSPNVRTTSRGRQYLDLSLYQGSDYGKARKGAETNGVIPVSKETADALKEVENARLNQQSILDQITGLLPSGPAGRVLGAPERKLSAIFQTNEQRAAFNSWRTAAINSLRATAGSKGLRINQAEIAQAVENDIPTLNDTLGTARQKNKNINTMLDNVETATLGPLKSNKNADPLGIR